MTDALATRYPSRLEASHTLWIHPRTTVLWPTGHDRSVCHSSWESVRDALPTAPRGSDPAILDATIISRVPYARVNAASGLFRRCLEPGRPIVAARLR